MVDLMRAQGVLSALFIWAETLLLALGFTAGTFWSYVLS
jgi:hypothetical protein